MVPTVCSSCNLTIHPNFVGHHKCGYGNCPVCKTPVTKSEYWSHIKTHPGHENDNPPNQKLHAPQLGLIATDIVLINLGSSDFYQTYLNEGLPTISQVYNDIPDMEGELNSIFLSRKGI